MPANDVVLSPGSYAADPSFSAGRCYFLAGGAYRWQAGYTNDGGFVSNKLRPPDEPMYNNNTILALHQFWNTDGANCAGSFRLVSQSGTGIREGAWAILITALRTAVYAGVNYLRESAPSMCRTVNVGDNQVIQVQISNVPGATSYNVYSGAPMTLVMSLPTNSFTETGLTANTRYTRVATAIVSGLESTPSNSATVSTLGNPVPVLFNNQFRLLPGSPFPRILTPLRPENRRLFFLFENPTNAVITGMMTDIRGVKVRDLSVDGSSPFVNSLVWDVKDEHANIVPSGIYLYKITDGNSTVSGGVVVAR